jgi:predicted protein tyrosine phosphatase
VNNRLYNCTNPSQGKYKRVLCVCSAGLLRSPTAAYVLSQDPFNYNTRAAGVNEEYALVYALDQALLSWAQEIVCMQEWQTIEVKKALQQYELDRPVITLVIPDQYEYRHPELQALIKTRYEARKGDDK